MCFSTNPSIDIQDWKTIQDNPDLDPNKGMRMISPAFLDWLKKQFQEIKGKEELKAQVYPLDPMPFIRILDCNIDVQLGIYGLLPERSWITDINKGRNAYNARSETIFEKPTFKKAVASQRCILPTKSFWEWTEKGLSEDGKAHLLQIWMEDKQPFGIAGLWEFHPKYGYSCSIVTTEPIEQIKREGHTRSPLILQPEQFSDWLDPNRTAPSDIQPLIKTWAGGKLNIKREK